MSQRKPKMDWPEIVAALHRAGMTLSELAKRNSIPVGSITIVKSRTHYASQDVIAEFLGEKPEDLWPDRYPKGKPRILDTKKYPPVNSQKESQGSDSRSAA